MLAGNALFRLCAAEGVLGLADKQGPVRLELACAKAIAVGDPDHPAPTIPTSDPAAAIGDVIDLARDTQHMQRTAS